MDFLVSRLQTTRNKELFTEVGLLGTYSGFSTKSTFYLINEIVNEKILNIHILDHFFSVWG